MTKEEFKQRTQRFASDVIRLVAQTEPTFVGATLLRQLLKAGTSVGSNYRAACRARSDAEMHSKLCTVEEEADECCFWLELLLEHGLADATKIEPLLAEADQIVRMVVASKKRLSSRLGTLRVREYPAEYETFIEDDELGEHVILSVARQSTIDNRQ